MRPSLQKRGKLPSWLLRWRLKKDVMAALRYASQTTKWLQIRKKKDSFVEGLVSHV